MSDIKYLKRINAGSSVSFNKTILNTLIDSNKKGIYSIQFFMGSYISMNRTKISNEDILNSNNFLKRYKLNVFTHLPYVHNLCGKDSKLYNECTEAKNHVESSILSIAYEINTISKIIKDTDSKGGCVLHIGSIGKNNKNNSRKEALQIVIYAINKICSLLDNGKANLLLETMVGRGGVLGSSLEELKYIYNNLQDKSRVGICIDTCHIHAEGLYTLSDKENIDKLFKDYLILFDLNTLQLIHLNDSCHEFNCKKDRHESLFKGHIWKKNELYYFIDKLEELNIPYVLETPGDDYPILQQS